MRNGIRVGAAVATATVAMVAIPPSAEAAGGYWHKNCVPQKFGYTSSANLDVVHRLTTYGQRYDIDADAGGFTVRYVKFDGVKLKDWNNTYVNRRNRSYTHTIEAVWYYGPYLLAVTTRCIIKG